MDEKIIPPDLLAQSRLIAQMKKAAAWEPPPSGRYSSGNLDLFRLLMLRKAAAEKYLKTDDGLDDVEKQSYADIVNSLNRKIKSNLGLS